MFNNFFSETGSHPRHGYRLKPAAAAAAAPSLSVQQDVTDASRGASGDVGVQTSGQQRYLFFNRPLIPYMQAMPAHV